MRGFTPEVARPANRAIASGIAVLSSAFATLRFAAAAIESWLDEKGEIFDARADVDDPELIEEFAEDEDE